MITKLLKFFSGYQLPTQKSQVEAYLANSKDIFELENKMKILRYRGYWI